MALTADSLRPLSEDELRQMRVWDPRFTATGNGDLDREAYEFLRELHSPRTRALLARDFDPGRPWTPSARASAARSSSAGESATQETGRWDPRLTRDFDPGCPWTTQVTPAAPADAPRDPASSNDTRPAPIRRAVGRQQPSILDIAAPQSRPWRSLPEASRLPVPARHPAPLQEPRETAEAPGSEALTGAAPRSRQTAYPTGEPPTGQAQTPSKVSPPPSPAPPTLSSDRTSGPAAFSGTPAAPPAAAPAIPGERAASRRPGPTEPGAADPGLGDARTTSGRRANPGRPKWEVKAVGGEIVATTPDGATLQDLYDFLGFPDDYTPSPSVLGEFFLWEHNVPDFEDRIPPEHWWSRAQAIARAGGGDGTIDRRTAEQRDRDNRLGWITPLPPGSTVTVREPGNAWMRKRQAEMESGASASKVVHTVLDVAGTFDPTPFSDGANAIIYLIEGNYAEAVCSAVSIIPYAGDAAKAGKYSVRVMHWSGAGKTVTDFVARDADDVTRLLRRQRQAAQMRNTAVREARAGATAAQRAFPDGPIIGKRARELLSASLDSHNCPVPAQAHHIVGVNQFGGDVGRRLHAWGIDLNGKDNGVWLPSKHYEGRTASLHSGGPNRAYVAEVDRRLQAATSREDALVILERIRDDLLNGRLAINAAK